MENTKLVQVHNTTKKELLETFESVVEKKLNELKTNFTPKQPTQLLNRKQTAAFFSVSVVTIDSWCDKGILQPYRTANRKYFKRTELEKALTKIEKQ